MSGKILCVDDDLNILGSFQRNLRGKFQITGALGGERALRTIADHGPFAVVVSDLQMPGMDGLEFLSRVRQASPDSVRIIFSGRANLDTAIAAVNAGSIFRFLTKPCAPELLAETLSQALEQHRLIVSERDLLEKTLRGGVQVLVDILGLVNPAVFSRSNRIRSEVLHIATILDALNWKWQLELAAMLSQIGCITFAADEEADFAGHPAIGARLIGNIPRLETVAEIISLQQKPFRFFPPGRELVNFGAQALHAAIDFDKLRSGDGGRAGAVAELRKRAGEYNSEMVSALASFELSSGPMEKRRISALELKPTMITLSNVYAADGALLIARDLEVSAPLVEGLLRLRQTRRILEPIEVLVPVTPGICDGPPAPTFPP